MVSFRSIDKKNFYSLLKMDPGDGGKFVASNAVSLAEAWLYYESHDTHPFAVYRAGINNGKGFALFVTEEVAVGVYRGDINVLNFHFVVSFSC